MITWNALKAVLRDRFICLSSYVKKKRDTLKSQLLETIHALGKKHILTGSKKVYKQLQAERKALSALEIPQIQKQLLFLKQSTWHSSPKALRLLAWKVRQKAASRTINSIRLWNGLTTSANSEILQAFVDYYKQLYSSSDSSPSSLSLFLQSKVPNFKLSTEHRDLLDEPITSEETVQAICALKLHKSPGTDGLPSTFYKKFLSQLSSPLTEIFNLVGTDGTMPPSWSQSRIIVLPKQGRDLLNLHLLDQYLF